MATKTASKRAPLPPKSDFEEDCGFVFRRKTPKIVPSDTAAIEAKVTKPKEPSKPMVVQKPAAKRPFKEKIELATAISNNPTPVKKDILDRHRRRSSLPGLALTTIGKRRSSIGIGLTHDLPPANVTSEVYHKHILPDLPGPLKMRQLLIWAIQKASKEMQEKSQAKRTKLSSANVNKDWEEMIAEPLIQALHTNELNTSWYQRPASGSTSSFRSNPINEEMKECLSLYQRYFKQLSTEYSQWKLIENSPIINADLESTQIDVETEVPSLASDIVSLNKWSSRLPLSIDRLGWLLNVYGSFEHRSRDFCEAVFKQIFDRFFADHQKGKLFAEPIQALKALSAAPSH